MNILSIGNSFSTDAQRYLHAIAKADGTKLNCFNLYIGGCTLSNHYRNMLSEKQAYTLEMNGASTGFSVSLKEALVNRDWDWITVQQASTYSVNYESYQPYLETLVGYVKIYAPKAKIAVCQTWAYLPGSARLHEFMKYESHAQMLEDVVKAYHQAAETVQADVLIPAGEVMGRLLEKGVQRIHRDDIHASLGLGRYAIALTWYHFLTGNGVADNSFCQFDEEVTAEEIAIAKEAVAEIADKYAVK